MHDIGEGASSRLLCTTPDPMPLVSALDFLPHELLSEDDCFARREVRYERLCDLHNGAAMGRWSCWAPS